MYLAYKKDDIYVKIVACLFISCFIVMCFIGKVFAIDLDYQFSNGTIQKITLPNWIEEKNYNYFFYVTPHPNASSTYWSSLIIAKGDISLKLNGASTTFYCNDGIYNFPVLQSSFSNIKNTTQAYTEPTTFSASVQPFNIYNGISSSNINFDTISVSANSWSDKDLYILFYDRSLMNNQDTQGLYPKKEIKLSTDTSYYIPEISSEQNAIYWIANNNTGLNFKVGGNYEIRLAERVSQSTGRGLSW